jgi:hypothetical protein
MSDPDGRVRFIFDERISETMAEGLEGAVMVSPHTGEVRVSHGRNALTVSLEGGFRPGLLYRVTLQPVVSDLFGNRMPEAFEVVFSTGGEAQATGTLAGEVWDRLSGRGVNGAMVQAVGSDSLVHVARTDAQGVFAFRYLPAGVFALTGYVDANRDREVSPREARGTTAADVAVGDTIVLDIPVLEPDTTPAVPGVARALDSLTIAIEFDDFLDPASSSDGIGVELTLADGEAPVVTRLFHEGAYLTFVEQVADSFARLDSADAAAARAAAPVTDSLADSLVAQTPAPDPVPSVPLRALPPRLVGTTVGPAAVPGRTRPGRRIVGQLDRPLENEVEYEVRVTAVVNLNGLPGGGGEVTITYVPPPPDTLAAPGTGAGNAAGARGGAAPGTVPDTLGVNR